MSGTNTLARRILGPGSLMILGVVASSPFTTLVGGIPTTYAATGVAGVPLSFLVITAVLALLIVGYAGVSRHVMHTAPFYALLARGIGGRAGTAAAAVEFVGYNAIEISLYAFLGTRMADLFGGGTWWMWAAAAWGLIAVFGLVRMTANTFLLGTLLVVELSIIGLFVATAFTHPAAGVVDLSPFAWDSLWTEGAGGVLALAMAAFVGFECGPVYAEEARSPNTVMAATFAVAGCLGVIYALLAWAVWAGVGQQTLAAGGDPAELVFGALRGVYGEGVVVVAKMLLVSSVLAAMMSFHHVLARNVFGVARERALPSVLAKVTAGPKGGTPIGGSLLQSAVAATTIAVFAWADADPIAVMFTWLSTFGALCVLSLLVAASLAAYSFYRSGGGTNENVFMRAFAPIVGAVAGGLVLLFMAGNLSSLLGLPPGSSLVWLLPMLIVACALAGWMWGAVLRRLRPNVYARLGRGTPAAVSVLDQRLTAVEV